MTESLKTLLRTLRDHHWTLSFAESCTGGRLAAEVARHAGVSDVFLGSVVSYSNESKERILDVRSETLQKFGAVSEATAREMARGSRAKFQSDWCVAITGIAGPTGGTKEKPVGTVCFGISGRRGNEEIESSVTQKFDGDRDQVQSQSVDFAISELVAEMMKLKT